MLDVFAAGQTGRSLIGAATRSTTSRGVRVASSLADADFVKPITRNADGTVSLHRSASQLDVARFPYDPPNIIIADAAGKARIADGALDFERVWLGDFEISGLSGSQGVTIPRRLTYGEMEFIKEMHNVEFSLTYDVVAKRHSLHSGTINRVPVPMKASTRWLAHSHPLGTEWASTADRKIVLRGLQGLGSPQKSSVIVPVGKKPFRFDVQNGNLGSVN